MIAPHTLLIADFLYAFHAWTFGLVFFALLVIAGETGFRLGRISRVRFYEDTRKRINAVEAAVLGVLGLLLAFTLVMAVSRFDGRRQLVIEESNAIGTSYWRSQLVPPPEGPELANLLREYVDAKLHYFDAGIDPGLLRRSRERTRRLQVELWSRAAAFSQKDTRSVPAGLLLQSLNQTFDLENSRWNALQIHVPDGVLWVDIFVGLLAALKVGYAFGIGGRRHPFSLGLLAACIAAVLAVTMDLDQPRQGLIQVNEQPLIDLQQEMADGR
ncbi:MAG TPA: hypothetical protein VI488_06975 [Candidatus Angelobacter sp.]